MQKDNNDSAASTTSSPGKEPPKITAISWTGGKDCNLALLYAKRQPTLYDVQYLVTFRPEGNKFRAHPIPFMEKQAECLGLSLLFVFIPNDTTDYMKAYVDGITDLQRKYGIEVICTGDMDLVGTMERNWMERCCENVPVGDDGMSMMACYLPLWGKNREECLMEMLREGFEIVYTCVKSPFFDGSWTNRRLDSTATQEMKHIIDQGLTEDQISKGIKPLDLCGERGEYHTMCISGPCYKAKVDVEIDPAPTREEMKSNWKGNIHNAETVWTVSLTSQ